MRVLVTGGTGFVGSHTVAALVAGGHEVRLLVRSPERIRPAMAPLGVDAAALDVVVGDVADLEGIAPAMKGMDALLHAASQYSFDPRRAGELLHVNTTTVRPVLAAAADAGLDPIVHVSSVVALLPLGGGDLGPEAPVGDPPPFAPYALSKARQERVARELGEEGAPIVCVYPGAVAGPHDPHDGETARLVRDMVRRRLLVSVRGGIVVVDVRDLAAVHAAVIDAGSGHGHRRVLAAGHHATIKDLQHLVGRAAGMRLPSVASPVAAAVAMGRLADAARRRLPVRLPISAQAAWTAGALRGPLAGAPPEAVGVTFRPLVDTVADQVRWQRDAGRL